MTQLKHGCTADRFYRESRHHPPVSLAQTSEVLLTAAIKGLPDSLSCTPCLHILKIVCLVQATSDMLADQRPLLPLLHQLEAVSSGSTIGPLSETLLEELQQSGSSGVGQAITQLRAATTAAMRVKATSKRTCFAAELCALAWPEVC